MAWLPNPRQLFLPALLLLLVGQFFIASPALATRVDDIPNLRQPLDDTWVYDEANVLNRATKGAIKSRLRDLSKTEGFQIRMVTGHRLDYGETPDSFASGLLDKWFPDPADQANQVVVFIDDVTNNIAIKLGDQVKSIVSDEIATSVAEETMTVPLRNGNKYNQALADGADRLITVLSGEPDPGPPVVIDTTNVESTFTSAEDTNIPVSTIIVVVLLIVATVVPMATYFWFQGS